MAVQSVKLGLVGAEQELPIKSRVNEGGQATSLDVQGRSADGSLKVDRVATIQNFAYSWGVMSEADFDDLYSIYELQDNDTFLSLIYTKQNGTEVTTQVYMQPPSRGSLIQRDVYFNNGVSISMEET